MPAYRFPTSKTTQENILDIWKGFIGELMWEVSPLKVLLVLLFYRSMLDGTKVLECSWTFLTSYPGHVEPFHMSSMLKRAYLTYGRVS